MSFAKCRSCQQRHSPSEQDSTVVSHGHATSWTTSYQQVHRAWVLIFTTLALVVLASGVSSFEASGAASTSTSSSSFAGSIPRESAPVRKAFPVSRVRQLLKELFQKRRAEMMEGMLQTAASSRPGGWRMVREMVMGGTGGGRERREAEEKRLLSFEQEDRLGTFIGEVMACQNIPGLSLAMTRGGARQGQGYGVADIETGRPVDKDTLFGIGSNTKAFAAASLAHVMASAPPEKRFSFSTPLSEILGEDFKLADRTRTDQTTLMDVLSHRTGLASADLGIFSGYPLNITTQDFCSRLKFLPEMLPFRSAWYYSNTMYVLVSRVCEVASGKNWSEVLEDAILGPLRMNNTFLTPEALSHENAALPYILRMRVFDMFVQQDPKLFDIHPMQAAGAVMLSAMDMTKWLNHLLNVFQRPEGEVGSLLRQLFTERTLLPAYMRQLAGVQTKEPILHIGYGMGFMASLYKKHMVYWHSGDFHGYTSLVVMLPDWHSAVYVAVNGPSGPNTEKTVLHIVYFVLEMLQGRRPWVRLSQVCPGVEDDEDYDDEDNMDDDYNEDDEDYDYDYDYAGDDTLQLNAHSQVLLRPIEDYLGEFSHGLLGDLRIVREQERNSLLRMELGRHLVADLIPTDDANIFKLAPRIPVADTKEWEKEHVITFKSSAAGAAAYPPQKVEEDSPEREDSDEADSRNVTKEVKVQLPLDRVQMRWLLETYVFEKIVQVDSDSDSDSNSVQAEQKAEHKHMEQRAQEQEISESASSVMSDSGATTTYVNCPMKMMAWVLIACLALAAQI